MPSSKNNPKIVNDEKKNTEQEQQIKKTKSLKSKTEAAPETDLLLVVDNVEKVEKVKKANKVEKEEKVEKVEKVKKEKKTKDKLVETQIVEVVSEDIQNSIVNPDTNESSIMDNFSEFITHFQSMLSQFNALKMKLKNLERITIKQLKVVQKINNKKKRKGTRAPSGFVKPSLISDELAEFLGKPTGSEMARTDVTREINKYIRANNLQDKENGRKINPDKPLTELLKITDDTVLTYFNLQRYMGPHFPKIAKTETLVV